MIDGLVIEMSSDKLRDILTRRAEHHHEKANWYRERANELSKEIAENPNISNNPTDALRRSQREHEGKYTFFTMLAENLVPNETYRLSEENCLRIELYSRYFQ